MRRIAILTAAALILALCRQGWTHSVEVCIRQADAAYTQAQTDAEAKFTAVSIEERQRYTDAVRTIERWHAIRIREAVRDRDAAIRDAKITYGQVERLAAAVWKAAYAAANAEQARLEAEAHAVYARSNKTPEDIAARENSLAAAKAYGDTLRAKANADYELAITPAEIERDQLIAEAKEDCKTETEWADGILVDVRTSAYEEWQDAVEEAAAERDAAIQAAFEEHEAAVEECRRHKHPH